MQQSICPSDGYATLSGHRNRKKLAGTERVDEAKVTLPSTFKSKLRKPSIHVISCCCSVMCVMMSCYGKHNKSRNNIGKKYITWRKLVNNYLTLLFLLVLLND